MLNYIFICVILGGKFNKREMRREFVNFMCSRVLFLWVEVGVILGYCCILGYFGWLGYKEF